MSVFFISDLHFGHNHIHKFGHRPWAESPELHDLTLVDRINDTVKKRDKLYILGDVAWSAKGAEALADIRCQNIEVVWGNHDMPRYVLPYVQKSRGFFKYKDFWVSHCPIHPNELRGLKNIHGHVHHNIVEDSRYISVCVDSCDGYPVAFDDIECGIYTTHDTELEGEHK